MIWWFRRGREGRRAPRRMGAFRPYLPSLPTREPFFQSERREQGSFLVPTLFLGLGPLGLEALRWLKIGLRWEEGIASDHLSFLVFLHAEHQKGDFFPITEEEIVRLQIDLRYPLPYTLSWWREKWAQNPNAVMPQGRLLWVWDNWTHRRILHALQAQRQRFQGQRFQVFLIGNPGELEFGMWHELVVWMRENLRSLVDRIYLIPAMIEDELDPALHVAILRHLSHMIERRVHFLGAHGDFRDRFIRRDFIVNHTFLFPCKKERKASLFAAIADMVFLFLDEEASFRLKERLSGSIFVVEKVHTLALPFGILRERCKYEWLHRMCLSKTKRSPTTEMKLFFTQPIEEVDGEFPFSYFWEVYQRMGEPSDAFYLPDNFSNGWRWRLEAYLNRLMNQPDQSLGMGLQQAHDFLIDLQRFLRSIKSELDILAESERTRYPAQELLERWREMEQTVDAFLGVIQRWRKAWWGIVRASSDSSTIQEYLNTRLEQACKYTDYFLSDVSRWVYLDRVKEGSFCPDTSLFTRGFQWCWRDLDQTPSLMLVSQWEEVPHLERVADWPDWVKALEAVYDRMFQQYLQRRPAFSLQTEWDPREVPSFVDPQHLASTMAQSLEKSAWVFCPMKWTHEPRWPIFERRARKLGVSQFITWRFPYRATWLQLIHLPRLSPWLAQLHGRPSIELFAYPEEQAFVELEQRGCLLQWHPEFVSMLAAKEALEKLCLTWVYKRLQVHRNVLAIVMDAQQPPYTSPQVHTSNLTSAFREALSAWWEGDDSWRDWWQHLEQAFERVVEERRRPSGERLRWVRQRRQEIEKEMQREERKEDYALLQYCLCLLERRA